MSSEESKPMFKKKVPFFRGVKRKVVERDSDDSDLSSSDDETVVVKTDRKRALNPLVQSTSSFNRKRATFRKGAANVSDDEHDSKRDAVSVVYRSDRNADSILPKDMGATATFEIDTEKDRDAQAIFERAQKLNDEDEKSNLYKGINNYKQYVQKKDTVLGNASSGLVRQGPIRAPDNLRSTIRWDYQPDVCKDYKETGFCGFGLSCKFLHDRSDYKHGWQIELEMQKGTYHQEDNEDYEIKEEEALPFKCLKCRKSFKNPIVTKCKHYFCETCALDHYRKSTQCYVCGAPTQGIFNPAKEIIKMLENKEVDEENSDDEANANDEQEEKNEEDEDDK